MIQSQAVSVAVIGLLGFGLAFAQGGTFTEDFSSDPARRGWVAVGETSLFRWDPTEQAVEVTWDSSKPNSYYAHPLNATIGRNDDFTIEFDLRLTDFVGGINPEKPNIFQLAVALINLDQASTTNFMRGSGMDSPNLVEFSFFPDPGGAWQWGPSITATMIDRTGINWSRGGFAPATLSIGDVFRVVMSYSAEKQVLRTDITRNGQPFVSVPDAVFTPEFTDLQVDHFAIASYSDRGQDPGFAGSILAHGTVDNVSVSTGIRLTNRVTPGSCSVSFQSSTNRLYTLERTADTKSWRAALPPAQGTGGSLTLTDTNAPEGMAFYRVLIQER